MHLGPLRWPALAAVTAFVGAVLVAPIALILRWVVRSESTDIDTGALLSALANTVGLALGATAVAVLAAVPVALLAARVRADGRRASNAPRSWPSALPGIVIAISVVYLGIRLVQPMYQKVPLLVLAYVVLFLVAGRRLRAGVDQQTSTGSTRSPGRSAPARCRSCSA